jgi:transcriptional regulator
MYLPSHFRQDDRASVFALAEANPFATLVTQGGDGLLASHVPLLVDPGRNLLRGHLARANPQLAHLAEGVEALAIFHGPHGYVSPSLYSEHPSVPTWNYAVVHARGRPRLVDAQALKTLLDDLVTRFDRSGWTFDPPEEYGRRMLGAIAGFEIAIESIEGKWKLSQNRSAEDQQRVATHFAAGGEADRALAALMRARRG